MTAAIRRFERGAEVRHGARMRRFAWFPAVVGLLTTSCAPRWPTLPTTATAEDRRQAEACHVVALKAVEAGPGVFSGDQGPPQHWIAYVPTPEKIAGTALLFLAAPVWYPIAKHRVDQRTYDAAFRECMRSDQAAAEPAEEETTR